MISMILVLLNLLQPICTQICVVIPLPMLQTLNSHHVHQHVHHGAAPNAGMGSTFSLVVHRQIHTREPHCLPTKEKVPALFIVS